MSRLFWDVFGCSKLLGCVGGFRLFCAVLFELVSESARLLEFVLFFFVAEVVKVCFDLLYDVSVCALRCFRWLLGCNVLLSNDVLFLLKKGYLLLLVVLVCLRKMFDCSRLLLS